MFRKAAITAAALIAMASVLTGCAPTTTYTGTAIVQSHKKTSKSCYATVEIPNQGATEIRVGRRSACGSITNGSTVTMENGYYKK